MAQSELEMTNPSSDDEEVSTEGSESESESESESDAQPSSRKTQAQSSSEESESDAGSPPKSPEKATPTIKPLASKPMDDEPSKKPRPQNPPTKPVNGKRKAVEVHDGGKKSKITKEVGAVSAPGPENAGERKAVEVHDGGKKSKITKEVGAVSAPGPENAGEKKLMFNRLWSEEDEIVLLKGMINYVDTKGKDPMADVNDLHEFVKSSLNVDVNNAQMSAKVRRLKKKFMNNEGKIEKHGKVRSFSNPHESKLYKLSEALWGRKNNKNAAGEVDVNGGIESVKSGIRIPITDEDITTRGLELLSGPKKLELEEKWNDLKVQQQKLYLKKLELMKEEGDAVLDAMMKSNPRFYT